MSPSQQNLKHLLAGVARGDEAAFAELYQASSAKLFAVALRILRNRELAEEVVQEAFFKVWERAGSYNPEIASPITWMATIVRNRSLDEVRRKKGKVFASDQVLDQLESEDEPVIEVLERNEDIERLMRCLEGLDPEKKEMVCLAYLKGMSRQALALKFDKPEGTVKTWLRRSLMQLKGCLDE